MTLASILMWLGVSALVAIIVAAVSIAVIWYGGKWAVKKLAGKPKPTTPAVVPPVVGATATTPAAPAAEKKVASAPKMSPLAKVMLFIFASPVVLFCLLFLVGLIIQVIIVCKQPAIVSERDRSTQKVTLSPGKSETNQTFNMTETKTPAVDKDLLMVTGYLENGTPIPKSKNDMVIMQTDKADTFVIRGETNGKEVFPFQKMEFIVDKISPIPDAEEYFIKSTGKNITYIKFVPSRR